MAGYPRLEANVRGHDGYKMIPGGSSPQPGCELSIGLFTGGVDGPFEALRQLLWGDVSIRQTHRPLNCLEIMPLDVAIIPNLVGVPELLTNRAFNVICLPALQDGEVKPVKSPLLAFAGIWDARKGPDRHWLQSFAIVTAEPNELMARIGYHHAEVRA